MGKVNEDEVQGLTPGTLIDGRYKVVRFIGQGGNGLVHEVEHVLTGRHLAMKSLLDEAGYGRLEQEARAASLMKNPHAVKITDMGTTPSQGPYIVMELLEGQSLRALLEETGQLPLELTANIALQVCECLAEAHVNGIIHRDLKPDNVYLCPGPTPGTYDVKVLDFGVVKIASDGPIPNSSLTRTGSTVGTPFYMSLEQLRNSSNVDARSDLYSLAVVLYEALSGSKPFQAETIGDLVYALCSGPPTHLSRLRPDLPPEVCEVIMRGLSMNREQRQASMHELATQLVAYGDASLASWLSTPSKRVATGQMPAARAPLTPAAPSKAALTPSGVKPGLAPRTPLPPRPAPPPEAQGSPARAESPSTAGAPGAGPRPPPVTEPLPPLSGAGSTPAPAARVGVALPARPSPPVPALSPPPPLANEGAAPSGPRPPMPSSAPVAMAAEPERPKPARPDMSDLARSGDRDTPTEMYVKGVHGVGLPPPAIVTGDRDTPTQAVDVPHFAIEARPASGGSAFAATDPLPQHRPTARLDAFGRPEVTETLEPLGEPTTSPLDPQGLRGADPLASTALDPRQSFSNERGPFGSPSSASASYPAQMTPAGAKPGWQQSLDRTLEGVGGFLERNAGRVATGFRTATPNQQIVIVVAGAALVAILIVLTAYLIIG